MLATTGYKKPLEKYGGQGGGLNNLDILWIIGVVGDQG